MLKNFIVTNTVVTPSRLCVQVTTKVIIQVLGLHEEGLKEPTKIYRLEFEIPPRGAMQQTKDVTVVDRRAQF